MPDELPDLPTLTADIEARGLDPDVAAEAIRMWRDEARPLVAGAAETQEDRWTFVDELDNRAEAAINDQRKRATTMWATDRFQDPGDLAMFQKAYDQSQGDPTRIGKIKTEDGTTITLDPETSSRFSSMADELNKLATLPEFRSTREERDMTGKINVGETTLARYTTRLAGNMAEVSMIPDYKPEADVSALRDAANQAYELADKNSDPEQARLAKEYDAKADGIESKMATKPLSFEILVPTDDEVVAAKAAKEAAAERAEARSLEIAMNPEDFTPTRELDDEAKRLRDEAAALGGKNGRAILLHDRIREKAKGDEFASIGRTAWGEDFYKGLQNATFSAAGLVSRVLPGTAERVLEGAGALPDTGDTPTAPDRALNFFAEAQGQQEVAMPGSTRNALVGGYWNDLATGARHMAGDMLPYLGAGLVSKVLAGAEGKAAMEAFKAAGVVPMGATGASMGAGMTGGSYLESMRRIADAEASGDTETADRIRRGMDAHAILTGALGAGFSKMSPLHNLELSGHGMLADMARQGAEMPLMGVTQRMIVDPSTLGDHPAIFEPIAQEFGLGIAMAFPLAIGSKIIESLGSKKAAISAETEKAKALAAETGADDQATIEALDQAHQVKVAAATEEAANEAKAVASQIKEIDDKLIAVETDTSLDEQAKKDAREPLIKAKLELYQKTESRNLREGERQMIDFDQEQAKLEALPSATEIHLSEMARGDQVTVGGEVMTVNSVTFDEDGNAQTASLISPRFGEIKLDVNQRTSVMADKPITPAQDAEYMRAVESGDMETAQRMVDAAAKAAGLVAGFHGTPRETRLAPNEFKTTGGSTLGAGAYFSEDKTQADRYDFRGDAQMYFLDVELPGFDEFNKGLTTEEIAAGKTTPLEGTGKNGGWIVQNGEVEFVVRDPSQIKSADPVTRDDQGNVIPLSQRFNPADNRMKARSDQKKGDQMMREGEAKMIDFDQEQAKLEAKPSATEVHISELNKGDVVTVGGEPMEVVSVKFDEDGVAQETTVRSERYGDITLDQNNRPTMMADAPAEKAKISTDFLGEDDFTSDQPPASLAAIDQPSQEPPPQSGPASAEPGQASGEASSGQSRGNVKPVASSDSPDARSIKNAEIDQWRERRGLKPMAKAGRKAWGYLWDKAMDTITSDPQSGYVLVDQLIGEGRAHSDEEAALLLAHFIQQENAQAVASDIISKSDPASDEFKNAVIRRQKADAAIEKAHEAMRMAGTQAGRALAARKMMVDSSEVPSVGAMMADRKIALGRNLSADERAEVEANHKELTEAKVGADAATAEIESEQLQAENAATVDEIANEILKLSSDPEGRKKIGQKAREKLKVKAEAAMKILREKGVIGGKTTNAMGLGGAFDADAMRAMIDVATYYIVEAGGVVADAVVKFSREFSRVTKEQIQSIFDNAQKMNERLNTKLEEISKSNAAKDKRKTPAQIIDKAKYLIEPDEEVDPSVVRALHRAHIEDGSKSEADVTNKVAESLREIYGREFTPDEVRRIHTQYGKTAQLPADDVSKIQRDLKRQQLLLVKIEALKKKQPLLATGVDREKNSHEVHVLQQELEAIKKSTNYRKTGKGQLSGLQDRIAARLDTLIADIKDQLLGNKPVRSGRSATEYDADNIARLDKLKAIRKELRASRSAEVDAAANEAAVKAAKAMKAEWERRLADEEWKHAEEPKRPKPKALKDAIAARDEAAADYHEAERNSIEWKTREVARKVAALSEELDTLEQKLADRNTSRGKKKAEGPTSDELKLMEDRKAEINSELNDIRKREPMTPEQERIYLEERLKAAEATETDLQNELNTGKKRDIFRRERPTSPALKAAQERIKDLRKKVADMRYGDGQAAFDKWAKDRVATLKDQLANGRKPGSNRSYPDTAENRAKAAEIKSLEAEMKRKESPAKRLQSMLDRIERLKKEEVRLKAEGWKAGKPKPIDTPEMLALKPEIERLEKIVKEWHANDGERDSAAYIKRLDAAEREMEKRIAESNFAPKEKRKIRLNQAAADRVKRFQEAQKRYFEMKLADRLSKMSVAGKVLDAAGQSLSVVRTVLAGGEFSMAGRQGLLPATMALRKAPGALVEMLRSFASEKAVTEAEMELKNRTNYALYQRDKLFLSDVKDWTEKKVEEANTGRWARKIPFFKNFERANSTVLNILRANAYDALHRYHMALDGVAPTAEQGRNIARQVNIMSSRSEFGKFELARPVGSKILFSPGHTISRFQFALGGALWTGDAKSRAVIALAYGKTIAALAALLGLAWFAAGDDDWIETDPRSSDFLKIKSGQTRIDVMAGMSQAIVFLSRMLTHETKRGGKIIPLTGPDVKFGAPDLGSTIGAFGRSKLNPFLGSAFNAWSEKDFGGNATDIEAELNKLWKPMTWGDIVDAAQAQGLTKGVVLGIGAMLGAGVSTYQPRKAKEKPKLGRGERAPVNMTR